MLPNHVIRIQICLLFDRSSSLIDFDYLANVQKNYYSFNSPFPGQPVPVPECQVTLAFTAARDDGRGDCNN